MLSSLYLLVVYLNLRFKNFKNINIKIFIKITFLLVLFIFKSFKAN